MVYSEYHRLEKQRKAQERFREAHLPRWVNERTYDFDGTEVRMKFLSARSSGSYGRNRPKREVDEARRVSLLMMHGGKCERCGVNDHRCLQFDHVDGGGCHKRKISSSHTNSTAGTWYGELVGTLQVLCANCNWIKRYENNEHRFLN